MVLLLFLAQAIDEGLEGYGSFAAPSRAGINEREFRARRAACYGCARRSRRASGSRRRSGYALRRRGRVRKTTSHIGDETPNP